MQANLKLFLKLEHNIMLGAFRLVLYVFTDPAVVNVD